jgi:hypothetical protein
MALNQKKKNDTLSKIFTWILAVFVIISVFAGAISSFLLRPSDNANALQNRQRNTQAPLPTPNIIQQSSSISSSVVSSDTAPATVL